MAKVIGLDRLTKRFNAMSSDITMEKGLRASEKPLVSTARGIVPVDDGELKASISARAKRKTLVFKASAKHAPFIEYGTYKMPARPFLKPSLNVNKELLKSNLLKAIMRAR